MGEGAKGNPRKVASRRQGCGDRIVSRICRKLLGVGAMPPMTAGPRTKSCPKGCQEGLGITTYAVLKEGIS